MPIKFKYTTEFQFDLLRFTVVDRDGYKALELYDDTYFTLVEHSVIAFTLKRYYKRNKRIPGSTILLEELQDVFKLREFINNLTDDDRKEILSLSKELYKERVKDGEEILKKAEKFAQFVDLKDSIEKVDLLDFSQYEKFSKKIQKAIAPRLMKREEKGTFLIGDVKDRQFKRQEESPIVPTPFRQINKLTNAGGYSRGSILVILDRAKKFKTGMLVNIARGYMRQRQKYIILIADLENGEDAYTIRLEQSEMNKTKREILSGDWDKHVQKQMRKYKRLKSEVVIKRFPAMITTAVDIEKYIEYLYNDHGLRVGILLIDFIGKMAAISGKDSLHERISDAYIDIGNLALKKDIIHVWTAQHVNKEAVQKREKSRYWGTDVAGSMDVTRYADAIFGLNRTLEEEEGGFQRMEIVDQRDGVPKGRAVFSIDMKTQRAVELSISQRKRFEESYRKNWEIEQEGEEKDNINSDIE